MATCTTCGRQNENGARFCSACGAQLDQAEAKRAPELRKTVTVVFSDLTGSTELGESLDAESVRRLMSRYYGDMRQAVERHGGTVEKFIGDAVMAVFGVPRAHEDDALRAVRAAFDMRVALERISAELQERWGIELRARTGINTGEVVVGNPSSGHSFVTADAVNVAARLEQAAAPGEILLGAPTFRLVQDAAQAEPVEPLELKGKSEPVAAFRLLGLDQGAPALRRRLDSPLVGRATELERLEQIFQSCLEHGRCELATVLGGPGVGKSKLIREFVLSLEGRAKVLVNGRCLPYGEGVTFWPVAEVVKEAAAVGEDEPPEAAKQKIAGLIADSPERDEIVERIAAAIGLSDDTGASEESFWALRKLLEALAERAPLVVVFDDIHWGEATFIDLLEYLAAFIRNYPILILCMARPELLEQRPQWATAAAVLSLEPLSAVQAEELVAGQLGQAKLPGDLAARIGEAAGGNPLFIEELLRMFVDDGVIEQRNGRWTAPRELDTITVPPTIHALLDARLDRLESQERGVIERASVVGSVFWRSAVHELSPEEIKARIAGHLQALVRRELIRPSDSGFMGEDAFRFDHLLICDAAYDGMLKEVRAELHERFADWMEQTVGERAAEYEEILGYHLERAYRYRETLGDTGDDARALATRAGSTLASAGDRAYSRGDGPAAAKLLGRACSLLPADAVDSLEARLKLGLTLFELGDLPGAETELSEVVRGASALGDQRLELRALLEQSNLRLLTSPEEGFDGLKRIAEQAVPVFERAGDQLSLARAWRHIADVPHMVTRIDEAMEALERALGHARRAGSRRQEGEILTFLAGALYMAVFYGPMEVTDGIRRCRDILEVSSPEEESDLGGAFGRITVAAPFACLLAMQAQFDEARRLYKKARDLLEEQGGQTIMLAFGGQLSGWIELLAGDFEAAEQQLRESYETLEAMGEKSAFSTVAAMRAEAAYEQGRDADVERFTTVSEEAAGSGDIASHTLWRATRARLLARRGELAPAEALAREAVTTVQDSEALNVEGYALLALGEVLALSKPVEATTVVTEALQRYRLKGNLVSAKKAEATLEQMRPAT